MQQLRVDQISLDMLEIQICYIMNFSEHLFYEQEGSKSLLKILYSIYNSFDIILISKFTYHRNVGCMSCVSEGHEALWVVTIHCMLL